MAFGNVPLEVEDCVALASSSTEGDEENAHAQKPGHLSLDVDRSRSIRSRALIRISCNIGLVSQQSQETKRVKKKIVFIFSCSF